MKGPRKIVLWVLLAGLGILGGSKAAAGTYIGGSLGRGETRHLGLDQIGDGSVLTGKADGKDSSWKIFAGFNVFSFVRAEFDYRDYGQVSFSAMSDGSGTTYAAGPVDGIADTSAVSIAGLAVFDAGKFKLFAKSGISRWRTETTVRHSFGGVSASKTDGSDPLYGVGGAWDFPGPGGLRLEFERITKTGGDLDLLSVGIHLRF